MTMKTMMRPIVPIRLAGNLVVVPEAEQEALVAAEVEAEVPTVPRLSRVKKTKSWRWRRTRIMARRKRGRKRKKLSMRICHHIFRLFK